MRSGGRERLGQNCRLDPAQLRTWLDTELLDQDPAGPLVGGQGVGLAAAPVQGRHQQAPASLAEGIQLHQPLKVSHQLTVLARREARFGVVLLRQTDQRNRRALGRCERDLGELRQRRSPPQVQGRAQCDHRRRRVAPLQRRTAIRGKPLEQHHVDRLGRHLEPVTTSDHRQRQVSTEDLAQPRYVHLNRVRRRRGWLIAPQAIADRPQRNDPVRVQQQQRQERALSRPADVNNSPASFRHLERAQ